MHRWTYRQNRRVNITDEMHQQSCYDWTMYSDSGSSDFNYGSYQNGQI